MWLVLNLVLILLLLLLLLLLGLNGRHWVLNLAFGFRMACLDWILFESGFVILWRELRIARVLLGLGPGLDVCERLSVWILLLRTKLRELLLLRRRRALSFSLCRLRTCSRLLLPGLLCWRQGGGCSSFGARLWRLLHSRD